MLARHVLPDSHPTVVDSVPLDGVVPGVPGRRAFPVRQLSNPDPFLMLDHVGPGQLDPSAVLSGPAHPHRGFETVSIFLKGSLDHVDSEGNQVLVQAGDVQVMNAGRGIMHGGAMRPDPQSGLFHEFQLWVNVPAASKMAPPSVQTIKANLVPEVRTEGVHLRIISGDHAAISGPAHTTTPTTIIHGRLAEGISENTLSVEAGYRGLFYIIAGSVTVEGATATAGQTIDLAVEPQTARPVAIRAGSDGAEFLLLSGKVLDEPVVFGGPFVMTTEAEVHQAYADYRAGKFGSV